MILDCKLKYTKEMEKAFQLTYQMCYAEYDLSLIKRLQVEAARDAEHQKAKQLSQELLVKNDFRY